MASITREITVKASAAAVWDAVRDVGQVHKRLGPGFLLDAHMEGEARIVHFANGAVAREAIVTIDDEARRLAYAVVQGTPKHHNASLQVFDAGEGRARLVWITDVLPNEIAGYIAGMMDDALPVMQRTLEAATA